ncbi:MAG: type II toxin-antitoxin system VapC family toxin [Prevotellaceae bacterium]|jgi:PIN domain nuclease of toxin-antitoxin system|nr:type II toxin-antitoxin system VapC family toxin [Prevotellaceae bacterium]
MRLLLDADALLWVLAGSKRIDPIREILLAKDNDVFVSAISWWEIVERIRRRELSASLEELSAAVKQSGFDELPVNRYHVLALASLPDDLENNFDLMLVAQVISEPMRLVTDKSYLMRYTSLILPI